ncbi:MAG: hypothetical protein FWE17_02145 [Alphaproteobacteria bacterium]|nr:hypothetical protein [Alphaproteobacteria bacterium]MCL2758206.1 hypothetical protein [Alphaproteobacteria bacterium]
MTLKNILKGSLFAGLGLIVGIGAAYAGPATTAQVNQDAICALVASLEGVFRLLRTLAFIGAAFIIMAWAWDFISKGDPKLEDVKKKGVGMIVGFLLLFMVGAILQFLMTAGGRAAIGCIEQLAW